MNLKINALNIDTIIIEKNVNFLKTFKVDVGMIVFACITNNVVVASIKDYVFGITKCYSIH